MYPLKFQPVFQQRIWGGQRLRAVLGKPVGRELERAPVGESWGSLADLPAGTVKADSVGAAADGSMSSVVANGPLAGKTLREVLKDDRQRAELMGDAPLHAGHFPLLVKFLDAHTDLSVQVHPDEAYCARNAEAHLKSEAWYIVHAEPGAKIYKGLKAGITAGDFKMALLAGNVEPLLNAVKVRTGDCHYLPSGTVHALGAGILAAEVQTPSDTTFRVFDWNRLGPDGKSRKLHVEEAMRCISFADANASDATPANVMGDGALVSCDYFTIERDGLPVAKDRELQLAGPAVWIILEGQGVITCEGAGPTAFARGDTLLLPAKMGTGRVRTVANSSWLHVQLPGGRKNDATTPGMSHL